MLKKRLMFERSIGAAPATGVEFPNFVAVAQAFGLRAVTVASESDLPTLDQALATDGPLVIDVKSATEHEIRLAMSDFKSGLQNVADRLLGKSNAGVLIIKLGAEGMLVLGRTPGFATASSPAMNKNPVDVAGAGDALLAGAGLTVAAGGTPWECAYLVMSPQPSKSRAWETFHCSTKLWCGSCETASPD